MAVTDTVRLGAPGVLKAVEIDTNESCLSRAGMPLVSIKADHDVACNSETGTM